MQITDYDMTWFIYIFDKEYVERMNNLNVHNPSTAVNPLAYVNDASPSSASNIVGGSGDDMTMTNDGTMGVEMT